MKKNILKVVVHNIFSDGLIFGYSLLGESHEIRNMPNQDGFGSYSDEKVTAIVVSDGVGTCKHSEIGALAASQTVIELSQVLSNQNLSDSEIKDFIISTWILKVKKPIDDYATTLRFVIVLKNDIVVGSIGDGVTLISCDGEFFSFESNEWFANYTLALRENVHCDEIKITHIINKSNIAAAVMTDGISCEVDSLKRKEFLKYIDGIMDRNYEFEKEIKDWVGGLKQNNGDDKTLVLLKLQDTKLLA